MLQKGYNLVKFECNHTEYASRNTSFCLGCNNFNLQRLWNFKCFHAVYFVAFHSKYQSSFPKYVEMLVEISKN